MAAISWSEIRGQKFTEEESREASDFQEVLANFDLAPDLIFDLFHSKTLTTAKRLFLAEKCPICSVSQMFLSEQDARIRAVIQDRISREN